MQAKLMSFTRDAYDTNLRWICKVKWFLLEGESIDIDEMVENPSQDIIYFTEKLSLELDKDILPEKDFYEMYETISLEVDQDILPEKIFYEMYEKYTSEETKDFDKFLYDHPGCVGISYENGVQKPMYETDVEKYLLKLENKHLKK